MPFAPFVPLLSYQATGLLQTLEVSKAVFMEPKGQGKIGGVLSKFYVSQKDCFAPFSIRPIAESALRSLIFISGGPEVCLSQLSVFCCL